MPLHLFFRNINHLKEINDLVASGKTYTTPLLNIYSDDVWVQLDSGSTYVANKTADRNFSEIYTVHIKGAKHLSLTDLPLFSPVFANMLQGGKADIERTRVYCFIILLNTKKF